MDTFGGSSQNGLYLVVISMHFRSCLKVKVQNQGYIFWDCQNIKYNFGVLEILHIVFFLGGGGGVNGRSWARPFV